MKDYVLVILFLFSASDLFAQKNDPIECDYFILTPKPSHSPRLTNVLVFGCGANQNFLYRIPRQGKRPIKFSASELPKGLKLDKSTGIITGLSPQKAIYKAVFKAKNKYGVSIKKFQIKMGDKLVLAPPMGWSSAILTTTGSLIKSLGRLLT